MGVVRGIFMAFKALDVTAIKEEFPSTFGRAGSGKPTVNIAENGRIQFSTEASKAFGGCKVVIPAFDEEGNRIMFSGFAETPKGKEKNTIDLVLPKASKKDNKIKNNNLGLGASALLKKLKYDFKAAGSQTFVADKVDLEKKYVVFTLPTKTPAKRPVVVRVKKVKAPAPAPSQSANGAPAAPQAPAVGDDFTIDT